MTDNLGEGAPALDRATPNRRRAEQAKYGAVARALGTYVALASAGFSAVACISADTRAAIRRAGEAADAPPREMPASRGEIAADGVDTPADHRIVDDVDDASGGRQANAGSFDADKGREPVSLAALEATALARHPRLVADAERVRALAMEAEADGALPPPELGAMLWRVPFEKPYAVDDAQMLMFSLQQRFPAIGSLDHAAAARAGDANASAALLGAEARELVHDVDRAFADYVEAVGRHRAHGDYIAVVTHMAAAARARLAAGGALADVTKADLQLAMMRADLARDSGDIEAARATINGLLARPPGAPLGPPRTSEPVTTALTVSEAARRAEIANPAVTAADARAAAARSSVEAADSEASLPAVTAGINYFHPTGGNRIGWGASVATTLPWLWGPQSDRADAAVHRAAAERAGAEDARRAVAADAARATRRVEAAAGRLEQLEESVRPAARRGAEAAAAGYAAGGTTILDWLDAVRSEVDLESEIRGARGELDRALADLDRAVGEHVARRPLFAPPTPAMSDTHEGGSR